MLNLVRKFILLVMLSIASIIGIYFFMYATNTRITTFTAEIFYALDKAGRNSGRTGVILGDSVCNQIWPQLEDSKNFSHIGSVWGISNCGTYLLLKKYLEHNPQTQEVYYVARPQTIGDMGLGLGYENFVIPFINHETVNFIAPETKQALYDKYGKFFVENEFIQSVLLNNTILLKYYLDNVNSKTPKTDTPDENEYHRISRNSVIYLAKMRELCREHNVKLYIRSVPMPDTDDNHNWENFKQDVKTYGFEDILGDFVENIRYCPIEWFVDGVHFTVEILDQYGDEIRASTLRR